MSYTSHRSQFPTAAPQPGDPQPREHAARWLAHLAAGRVACDPGTTPAQVRRHARHAAIFGGARHG